MKSKLIGLLLLPLLFGCQFALAQTVIFDVTFDSSTVANPNIVNFGDNITYSFSVTNIGNTQFSGDMLIMRRVDSVQVYPIDTLVGVTLGVNATIPVIVNDSIFSPRYGGGINILVIWPTATMPGVAVSTLDTVNSEIYVDPFTQIDGGISYKPATIYPNPAQHTLNLLLPDPVRTPERFSIINVQGQIVREMEATSLQMDVSELPSGMYFLQIEYQEGIPEKKPFLLLK